MMGYLRIILFSVGCAIGYGIIHDQVTAHLCVEYFTVGHPSLLGIGDPTVLAFAWGIIATWWVGLGLGIPLALIARVGPWPKLTVHDVRGPILLLMVVAGLTSLLAGLAGYVLARTGSAYPLTVAGHLPPARQALFMADAWAHESAYNVGNAGAILICLWAWDQRARRKPNLLTLIAVWRMVRGRILEPSWDRSKRAGLLPRSLAVVTLIVLVLATLGLTSTWFTSAGDVESAYFVVVVYWPVVLFVFWLLGTLTLFAARQPRAAAVFLVLCIVIGLLIAAYLFGAAGSTGVSVLEAFLLLDVAVIHAAWRLVIHPRADTPRA